MIGIDRDDVVHRIGPFQVPASVFDVRGEIRNGVHPKVFVPEISDRSVDLHTVDRDTGIRHRHFPGRGTTSEPDHERRTYHGRIVSFGEERSESEIVPRPTGRERRRVIDGVNRLALVQRQKRVVAILKHLDVVVGRFGFVNELAAIRRLDRSTTQNRNGRRHHESGDQRRRDRAGSGRAPEPEKREKRQDAREDVEGHRRSDQRDEHQDRQEAPGDRAERSQRVDAARGFSGGIDGVDQQSDRERSHEAEKRHRDREKQQYTDQGAIECPHGNVFERGERGPEDRLADHRNHCDRKAGDGRQREQERRVGSTIRHAATEPVADGEVEHRHADEIRPDKGRISKIGSNQA